MLINYASWSCWWVARANAIILSWGMEHSFVTEKMKSSPWPPPHAAQHISASAKNETQTSEPPVCWGPEFNLPFRKGRGEGSGNQEEGLPWVRQHVDKPKTVDLKRTNLLWFLYHMEFFEIFFTVTLNKSLEIELREKSYFFIFLGH